MLREEPAQLRNSEGCHPGSEAARAVTPQVSSAPGSGPHTPQLPLHPASALVMDKLRTSATGGGGHSLRAMLGGPQGGFGAAPRSTAFSKTLCVRRARGSGAPEHPWVRRKNNPQHPLLSGLNNRWPLVSSFYQREGNKNARLLFAASRESSLSKQRPREPKTTQEPYPGGESEDLVVTFFTFQKPQCLLWDLCSTHKCPLTLLVCVTLPPPLPRGTWLFPSTISHVDCAFVQSKSCVSLTDWGARQRGE